MAEPPREPQGLASSSCSSSSSSLSVEAPVNSTPVKLKSTAYQLINEQGTFFSEVLAYLLISRLRDGSSRQCVSILGPQSSGKSTLLNHVFDTSFEELPEGVGQRQTTKGIWASISQGTLILDVAGADNIDDGDEGEVLEKKLLLFSLVLSSVVIFNIKQDAIKLLNASCLKLFQEILEYRLTIFPQNEEKKVLLFCIKDYNGKSPRNTLIDQLKESINVIWGRIKKKPEFVAYSSRSLKDLFTLEFEVVFHPDIKNDEQNFNQDLDRIKESFPNYFDLAEAPLPLSCGDAPASQFFHFAPSAAYFNFVESTWDTIYQSPLITGGDIEAVKECSAIVGTLLSQFNSKFETLMKNVEDPLKSDSFRGSFNDLIASKSSSYDTSCSQYPAGPRERSKKFLVKSMMLQFLTQLATKETTSKVTKGLQDPNAYFWDKIREDRNTVKKIITDNFDSLVAPLLDSYPDLKVSIKKSSKDYVNSYFQELVKMYIINVCAIFDSQFNQWSWFDFFTIGLFTNVKDKHTKSLKYAKDLIDKLSRYQMDSRQSVEIIPPASVATLKGNLEAHADARKQKSLDKQRKKRIIAGGVAAGIVVAGVAVGSAVAMPYVLNALVLHGISWELICTSLSYAKTIMITGVARHWDSILAIIAFLFKNWDPRGLLLAVSTVKSLP